MNKKIRIIMAKPGLDGHDRGIKILARAYRDAGMEVINLGLRQTPKMIERVRPFKKMQMLLHFLF